MTNVVAMRTLSFFLFILIKLETHDFFFYSELSNFFFIYAYDLKCVLPGGYRSG